MAAISPVVSRLGQGTPNRGTARVVAPMRVSPTTSSPNASAASTAERRGRWGSGPRGHTHRKARGRDIPRGAPGPWGGQQPGADPGRGGAGGQAGRDPAGGGDPAGADHRDL